MTIIETYPLANVLMDNIMPENPSLDKDINATKTEK